MKIKLTFLLFFLSTIITIAQKKADSTIFKEYAIKNSLSFTFDGQKPIGSGWDLLESQFKSNQFVAWGEYHNSALFSKLASYALTKAAQNNFKNWVVETSPFVASELSRFANSANPLDSILYLSKDNPTYGVFPFFKTKEDVEMIKVAHANKINIWGIDQEFQMAFPYALKRIFSAQIPKLQNQYRAVYDSLQARWWMPKLKLLDSLKRAVPEKHFKEALENIKISREIYRNDDNFLRATLMKNNFYNYYENTPLKNEKVFLKMGANHLAKGMNLSTHILDIGNAAYEVSQRNKTGFANVLFVLRYSTEKGVVMDELKAERKEYPVEFLKLYDAQKWIVLDIRKLSFDFYQDKTLSTDAYQFIEKYDFLVISPEVK
jgi:hypothetical protein